jgi:plastocyanin
MTKWLAMLTACLALGIGAVGCGDDDDDDGGNGGNGAAEQQAPAGGGQEQGAGGGGGGGGGQTVEVSMQDIAFDPDSVEINTGDTVMWTNEESVGHDVTKSGGPGPDFSSGEPGAMGQGDSFEQTFNAAGEIEYVCTVHQANMTGTITVR